MKKWVKVVCIVAASMIGVGMVFLIAGVLSGAQNGVILEQGGIKLVGREPYTYETMDITSVDTIDIDVSSARVEIVASPNNAYGLSVSLSGGDNIPDISTEGGKIRVNQSELSGFWHFSFDLLSLFSGQSEVITVYVPQHAELEQCQFYTNNGAISVETPLTTQNLKIDTSNGKIELSDLICKRKAEATTSNGAIICDGSFEGDTFFKTSNGKIELSGTYKGRTVCKTSNGSIAFATALMEKEYDVETNTSNGSIRINGDKVGDDYKSRSVGADNTLDLDTSNGSIDIRFSNTR